MSASAPLRRAHAAPSGGSPIASATLRSDAVTCSSAWFSRWNVSRGWPGGAVTASWPSSASANTCTCTSQRRLTSLSGTPPSMSFCSMAAISVASTSAMSSSKAGLTSSTVLPACRSLTMSCSAWRRAGSMVCASATSAIGGRVPVCLSTSVAMSSVSRLSGTLPCSATVSSVAMRPTVRRSTGLVSFLNSGWYSARKSSRNGYSLSSVWTVVLGVRVSGGVVVIPDSIGWDYLWADCTTRYRLGVLTLLKTAERRRAASRPRRRLAARCLQARRLPGRTTSSRAAPGGACGASTSARTGRPRTPRRR